MKRKSLGVLQAISTREAVGAVGLALIVYGTARISVTAAILVTGFMLFFYAYKTAK